MLVVSECVAKRARTPRNNASYSDPLEQCLKEDLIVNASLDDLFVIRQVDQHCEGIFGDCCVIFDQQLEISDGLECVALEQTRLSSAESNQVFGSCNVGQTSLLISLLSQHIPTNLADLGVAMVKELNELGQCQYIVQTNSESVPTCLLNF